MSRSATTRTSNSPCCDKVRLVTAALTDELSDIAPTFGPPIVDTFVYGKPARQGSNKFLGRGRVKPDDEMLYWWRDRVATAVTKHRRGKPPVPAGIAVVVSAIFHLPKPASYPLYKLYPIKDRDLDKLVRALLDALASTSDSHPGAGIIADDNRVIALSAVKLYAPAESEAGVHLQMWEVPPGCEKARWVPTFQPSFIQAGSWPG